MKKIKRLAAAVIDEFGYTKESDIWNSPRSPLNCWSRWIMWHYMLKWGMSQNMIARYSGFDHGAVSYGAKMLQRDLLHYDELQEMFLNVASAAVSE